ncbi:MAG TPA: S8 family serine peptidase [Candidatus Binatia bacterium]|nr:S8 family serine peptidase [Candidatus Binatia bacterium]
MIRGICFSILACLVGLANPAAAQTARTVVTDETQLPRFSYSMATPPSQLVVASDATFAAFLRAVESDVNRTLATYEIRDKATLSEYLSTRLAGQVLAGDAAGARGTVAQLRAVQSKPDRALLAGRLQLVYVNALTAQKTSGTSLNAVFAAADRAAVAPLPWSVVQDSVKATAGFEPVATRDQIVGRVGHDLDPIAAKTGTLDGPSARDLVQTRAQLALLPFLPVDAKILDAYIARHNVMKPDIWAARDVTLRASQVKMPVRIGILDSGVDPHDYPGLMYGGDSAQQHGLAFADDGTPSTSDTYPLPANVAADYPKLVNLMTGTSDMQSGIVSPEASAAQAYLRSLNVAQDEAFEHEMDFVGEYSHGSHVAGIASRGNPGARIVVARFDDNLPNLAFAPTVEWANRMAANFALIGAFFRDNDVRVVNMSWGDQVSEFEQWLAKTDPAGDAKQREAKAKALYVIWRTAVANMIARTPGTLFVAAAGNGDNDAAFAQDVPASLVYPNLITVGAVNQAGDPTGFTSYGQTVAVYADGYHVPSKIPQGYTVKFSGTSMASPNVTNLAAKLFAIDPSLTPIQVRALIVEGARPVPGGKLKLIDPKRSVTLLKAG